MENRTQTGEGKTVTPRAGWRLKTGDTLGVFRILRPLGRGGMGEVYEVEHRHLLKRYALKLLLDGDADFVTRFRREARIMADMRHPNLVAVHDLEVDEAQGRCFLIMDFVAGPSKYGESHGAPRLLPSGDVWLGDSCSLADRVPKFGHRLDERHVRDLALEVCQALSYAHAFGGGGVVHRDLKPSNILLDAGGHAMVTDFGVAKVYGEAWRKAGVGLSRDAAAADASGALGTTEYMAPEQRAGKPVSPRTDLYALGVLLYRLLVGYLPSGLWKLPSKCGVDCSRGWDRIVRRCLAVDPDARYADAAELGRALEALRLPSDAARTRDRAARWVTAGVSVVLLALGAGVMLLSGQLRHAPQRTPSADDSGDADVSWRVWLKETDRNAKAGLAGAVDGDPLTEWRPQAGDRDAAVCLDLGDAREIGGVTCQMPAAERMGPSEGSPVAVEVAVSRDGMFWSVVAGTFSPAPAGEDGLFRFGRPLRGRYVSVCLLDASRGLTAVVPELGILLADGKKVRLHL